MLTPGEMIGPYEILAPLGKGGMGEVFRARDTRLERDVAIKILVGELSDDAVAMSRFAIEAKALAALSHSNIIAIHDFGTDQGISYAVMELLKGQTLREKLTASKMSEKEALEIATEIVNGLCAAHSAGVIHRDLKPENIFLTGEGGVKILDFGLARRGAPTTQEQTSAATVSQSDIGVVVGTVPYMSPEQVRGEKVDARTDMFSFGAVLYEMLSGERLFARKTSADTISAILNEKPSEIPVSPEVNQIIQHCLEKNPDQRFQTARDLLFALKSVSTGTQIASHRPSTFSLRKRTFLISLIALILLLAIGGSFYLWISRDQSIHSVAVLPFANVSQNPDSEYLSDGITDSVITKLSSLQELRVMARGTAFTFKGREIDPRKAGRDLNVEAVVTGKLSQHGEDVIITADLVRVSDGTQLWSNEYNKKLADVLAVQHEISNEIVKSLKLKLTGEQKKSLTKLPTENAEAYRLVLKGSYYWHKNTEEDYEKARQYFQKALDLDPTYAAAHYAISNYYGAVALEGLWPPNEAWPKAEAALNTALHLDPDLGDAYAGLGRFEYLYKWNWEDGELNYKRAREAHSYDLQWENGHAQCLLAVGRFNDAIKFIKEASQADPLSRRISVDYAQILSAAGKDQEAIEQLKKTIRLDPTYDAPHFTLAQIYENKSMIREAIAETIQAYHLQGSEDAADLFREAKDLKSYQQAKNTIARFTLESFTDLANQKYVSPIEFARLHAELNEKDEAFAWLEKAFKERSAQLIYIRAMDDFKNLRSDPRFDDLVNRIGLPKI